MPLDLLCLDADDTLWHHLRHFIAAEHAFAALMAPYADEATARARLETISVANIPHYGYGAKSFTLSMIETATLLCGETLPTKTVAALLATGRELLSHPVELIDGVAETLADLSARVRLVLVTKGDLVHQEAKLAASGLREIFEGVEIVSDKTPSTFARLFARYGVEPKKAGMAGDSLRSDILPVLEVGGWGAYLPPEVTWAHEHAEAPEGHPRFTRLTRFAELPAWVDLVGSIPR